MQKTPSRFLSILLCAALLLGFAPLMKAKAAKTYHVGDMISFGTYPQSRVRDEGLKAELKKLKPDGRNDVSYNGHKYRKYARAYGKNSVTDYYLYEKINWKITSVEENAIEILADKILDQHVYNESGGESLTWANCSLRQWLNNDFYNTAFNETEKSAVLSTRLDNSRGNGDEYDHDEYTGPDTTDKIYVPSYYDMDAAHGLGTEEDRQKKSSDFANAKRIYGWGDADGFSCWWLRSRSYDGDACNVYPDGNDDGGSVDDAGVGCAPALKLNLKSEKSFHLHSYAWVTEKEAAPGTIGEKVYKCTVCGDVAKRETIPDPKAKYKVGDTLTLGSYPQTGVTSSATISKLDKLKTDARGDVVCGGQKYRKYKEKYFLYEPIIWQVVSVDGTAVELLSKNILDQHVYDDIDYENATDEDYESLTWENCSLRQWLNNDFYSAAFTESEKSQIAQTRLNNLQLPDDWYTGADTADKIYVLHPADLDSAHGLGTKESRQKAASQFASEKGIGGWDGFSCWWLRSRYGSSSADYVYPDGNYCGLVNYTGVGCAPALKLNLTSSGSCVPSSPKRENVAEAACTKAGGYDEVVYCADCGKELSRKHVTVPALGHSTAWCVGREPLPGTSGELVLKCGRCGKIFAREQFDGGFLPGDADGDKKVTAADARLALRAAVGLERLEKASFVNADASADGEITAADARKILRAAVGLESLGKAK